MKRTPLAWSFSALEDFVNCPFAFAQKRVFKSVKESETEAIIWGNWVHKQFELRLKDQQPLPAELHVHEPLMQQLAAMPGILETEKKEALNQLGHPCPFFDKHAWWRGVVDLRIVNGTDALIVDYKTGKMKPKFKQLKLFAISTFMRFPDVQRVVVKFYWTQHWDSSNPFTVAEYTRDQLHALWREFVPDLKQYVEAFKTDTWQKRPSGLCFGWCPVKTCEHWKPKRA